MWNKLMKYVSIVLVLGICGSAMAADWLGGAGNYSDSTKWSTGVVPVKTDGAATWVSAGDSDVLINAPQSSFEFFANGGSVTVAAGGNFSTQYNVVATANASQFNVSGGTATTGTNLFVGDWGQSIVNLSSGTLNVGDTLIAGAGGSANGTLNVSGGIMTTAWNWYLGDSGTGTVNVSGGSVVLGHSGMGGNITIGQWGTATGNLNVSGGSIIAAGITLSGVAGTGHVSLTGGLLQGNTLAINNIGVSTFDIAGGTLNLKGDITSLAGVTGNGILGNLQFAYNPGTDFTSITAIPEPMTLLLLGAGSFAAFTRRRRS